MENRVVISFSSSEAMEVERIVLDQNKDEAFKIMETLILKKLREASRPH